MNRDRLDNITVISFDGDATLWDFEKAMRDALAQALDLLRSRLPGPATAALTVDRMDEIRNRVAEELDVNAATLEEIRYEAFVRTVAEAGSTSTELARELNSLYRKHRFGDIELYPDVIPALDALASCYTLGLLSNGNTLPEYAGLGGWFAFVIFAQDVGVRKPDPGIFRLACERAGCCPDELLHVGDSLSSDVAGANGFGATSVWLNRDGALNDTDAVPDYEMQSLSDLTALLGL
ncbi:MAG: HAD family hydrolase [Anaerolineae bacterium]|nr:HAD family hydrolase [Anaerolineae bacterium]